MRLNERILEATSAARERAAQIASRAVDQARGRVSAAARRVELAKTSFETLALATQELNAITHRHAARLIDQNTDTIKRVLATGAERLRRASKADGVRELINAQKRLTRDSRSHLRRDAEATWAIVTDAGKEVSGLAVSTYSALKDKAAPKRTRVGKTAGPRRRKVPRAA